MNIFSSKLLCRILPVAWVQPKITKNGTPYVDDLAVTSNYGTAYNAFDGNASTYIQQYGNEYSTTGEYTMYLKVPVKASSMEVTYGSWSDAFNGVKTKTVQVLKNGSWVTLYTHTASNGLGDGEPETTKIYPVNPDGYYQAYRLLTTTNGSGHWDMVRIAEIKLIGEYEDYT